MNEQNNSYQIIVGELSDSVANVPGKSAYEIAVDNGFEGTVEEWLESLKGVVVEEKDVNFYDYNGTRLYSYTLEEANALEELPVQSAQYGLTKQGWNHTLKEVQDTKYPLDIGALYITNDGKTRLYINIPDVYRMDIPLYFSQTAANGVVIDKGDGSEPFAVDGTGNRNTTLNYTAPGEYCITLEVLSGTMGLGNTSASTAVIGGSNQAYRNMLYKVETGTSVNFNAYAFSNCYMLRDIVISNSVTSIGNYAFSNCRALYGIVFSNSVISIGTFVAENTYNLAVISIPKTVETMGATVFRSSYGIRSISIPRLAANAFTDCVRLQKVIVREAIASISSNSFSGCVSLQSFDIPETVTSIEGGAFQNCSSLQRLEIPESVTTYGGSVFSGCTFMKSYTFRSKTPVTINVNTFGSIPSDCKIYVPDESVEAYKAASGWSNYAGYIYPVSERE